MTAVLAVTMVTAILTVAMVLLVVNVGLLHARVTRLERERRT